MSNQLFELGYPAPSIVAGSKNIYGTVNYGMSIWITAIPIFMNGSLTITITN